MAALAAARASSSSLAAAPPLAPANVAHSLRSRSCCGVTPRALVSKKKLRFVDVGGRVDLDLSYITDRVVAMGWPSAGLEALYRNSAAQVRDFLEQRHGQRFRIYNLCIERDYRGDGSSAALALRCEVERFCWYDHTPPPLALLRPLCASLAAWTRAHADNVVVVHCKAGKGRTGTVIAAFLVHSAVAPSADAALELFGWRRTRNGRGVTLPGQQRYVRYYALQAAALHCDAEAWPDPAPLPPPQPQQLEPPQPPLETVVAPPAAEEVEEAEAEAEAAAEAAGVEDGAAGTPVNSPAVPVPRGPRRGARGRGAASAPSSAPAPDPAGTAPAPAPALLPDSAAPPAAVSAPPPGPPAAASEPLQLPPAPEPAPPPAPAPVPMPAPVPAPAPELLPSAASAPDLAPGAAPAAAAALPLSREAAQSRLAAEFLGGSGFPAVAALRASSVDADEGDGDDGALLVEVELHRDSRRGLGFSAAPDLAGRAVVCGFPPLPGLGARGLAAAPAVRAEAEAAAAASAAASAATTDSASGEGANTNTGGAGTLAPAPSLALASDVLALGDELRAVNGVAVARLPFARVVRMLRDAADPLRLGLFRRPLVGAGGRRLLPPGSAGEYVARLARGVGPWAAGSDARVLPAPAVRLLSVSLSDAPRVAGVGRLRRRGVLGACERLPACGVCCACLLRLCDRRSGGDDNGGAGGDEDGDEDEDEGLDPMLGLYVQVLGGDFCRELLFDSRRVEAFAVTAKGGGRGRLYGGSGGDASVKEWGRGGRGGRGGGDATPEEPRSRSRSRSRARAHAYAGSGAAKGGEGSAAGAGSLPGGGRRAAADSDDDADDDEEEEDAEDDEEFGDDDDLYGGLGSRAAWQAASLAAAEAVRQRQARRRRRQRQRSSQRLAQAQARALRGDEMLHEPGAGAGASVGGSADAWPHALSPLRALASAAAAFDPAAGPIEDAELTWGSAYFDQSAYASPSSPLGRGTQVPARLVLRGDFRIVLRAVRRSKPLAALWLHTACLPLPLQMQAAAAPELARVQAALRARDRAAGAGQDEGAGAVSGPDAEAAAAAEGEGEDEEGAVAAPAFVTGDVSGGVVRVGCPTLGAVFSVAGATTSGAAAASASATALPVGSRWRLARACVGAATFFKAEIDGAVKDRKHRVWPRDLQLAIAFSALVDPAEGGAPLPHFYCRSAMGQEDDDEEEEEEEEGEEGASAE